MRQFAVDHGAVSTGAVVVIITGEVGEVHEGLTAFDIALIGADTHGAAVEVDISIQVENGVREHQVDGQ